MSDYSFGKKIVEGGLWLSGSAFLVRVIGLVTTILILKFLSVEEYGLYQLVLAAFGFLASFLISGFDSLIINDLARERGEGRMDRVKRLFLEYGTLKVSIGIVLFLAAFFGSQALGRWYASDIAYLTRIMSFLFLFIVTERLLFFLNNVHLKFMAMSLFTAVEELAKLALVFILVVRLGWGVEGLVVAYTFSTAAALLVFAPYGIYLARFLFSVRASTGGLLLDLARKHGKWGLASRYLGDAQRNVRPWLIGSLVGVNAVGLYSLAEGIYTQLLSLLPISNVLAPLVPGEIKNHERMRAIMLYGIKYGTILFVIMGIAALLFIPYLVEWFFPKYIPALPLFRIMLLALLTTAAANVVNTILFSYHEQKLLFLLTVLRLVFLVVVGIILIRFFGLMGVAFEFVLTAVFFVLIRYISLRRIAPHLLVPIREFFKFSREDYAYLRGILKTAVR